MPRPVVPHGPSPKNASLPPDTQGLRGEAGDKQRCRRRRRCHRRHHRRHHRRRGGRGAGVDEGGRGGGRARQVCGRAGVSLTTARQGKARDFLKVDPTRDPGGVHGLLALALDECYGGMLLLCSANGAPPVNKIQTFTYPRSAATVLVLNQSCFWGEGRHGRLRDGPGG